MSVDLKKLRAWDKEIEKLKRSIGTACDQIEDDSVDAELKESLSLAWADLHNAQNLLSEFTK